jgi:hypothetical protein
VTETATVEQVAEMVGISKALLYKEIRETNQIFGIQVLRARGRVTIPLAPLRRLLDQEQVVAS